MSYKGSTVTLPTDPQNDIEELDAFHDFCEQYHVNWESERGYVAVEIDGEMEALYPEGILAINDAGEVEIEYEGNPALAT